MSSIDKLISLFATSSEAGNNFICQPSDFLSLCSKIKEEFKYVWLLDVFVFERLGTIRAEYLFCFLETEDDFRIQISFEKEEELPSVKHLWGNAAFIEQEIQELYGLSFSYLYKNILFHREDTSHPMLLDSDQTPKTKVMNLEETTSLMHSRIGSAQVSACINFEDGLVSKASVASGKYFCGIEKILRGQTVHEFINLSENYFLGRGASWSLAFCKTVEMGAHIVLPDRAMALRMIEEEFLRVLEHLTLLRNLYYELKAADRYIGALSKIKKIQSLIISFCGNDKFHNMNRIGGLRRDIDQSWMSRAMNELEHVLTSLEKEYTELKTDGILRRVLDFPIVDKKFAFDHCLTGPVARSAGVNLDFRKSSPHYFYNEIDFDVPIGIKGSGFDLFCVRFEEMFQSLKIIIQVLDNLPTGHLVVESLGNLEDQKNKMNNLNVEEYEKTFHQLKSLPDIKGAFFFEGANGHLGLQLNSSDSKVSNVKFFSNDFNLKNSFNELSKHKSLDQLKLAWCLLGIDMKSVER